MGTRSWVPEPQTCLGSGLRRLRGVSRSAAVRSLLTSCPKGGETARPRAGRSGAHAQMFLLLLLLPLVVGAGPEDEARRRPRGVLPRGEQTGTSGSGKKAVAKLVDRIRAWTKLQTWLEATVGRSWPHSVDDVLGYLECSRQRRDKCRGIAAGSPGRALHGGRWRGVHRGLHRLLHSLGQLPARAGQSANDPSHGPLRP